MCYYYIDIQYDGGCRWEKNPHILIVGSCTAETFLLSIIGPPLSNWPSIQLKWYSNLSKQPVRDHLTWLPLVFTGTLWNDTFLCKAKHDLLPQNTVLGSARTNYGTKRSPRRGPLCLWIVLNVVSFWAALWGLSRSTDACRCGHPLQERWERHLLAGLFSLVGASRWPLLSLSPLFVEAANLLRGDVFVRELRHSLWQMSGVLCHAACHIKEVFQGRLSRGEGRRVGGTKMPWLASPNPVSHIPEGQRYIPPCCLLVMLPSSDWEASDLLLCCWWFSSSEAFCTTI